VIPKLLITGGLGYIGSFTARSYQKNKKTKAYSIDNLTRGNNFANKFSINFKLDISDNRIRDVIIKNNINTVLHLAAYTCVRESEKKTKKYLDNNYKKQIKFINNLRNTSVKYLIFSSSLSIFEKNKFKKNPSPYSKYKLKIEEHLKKISSRNFKVLILRYSNVIGSDQNGTLGEKNNHISRIVPSFYKNLLGERKNILFFDYNKRIFPSRNYIHVLDVANVNLKMIHNYKNIKKKYFILNVFNNNFYSNFEVLKTLSKILKIKYIFKLKQISKKESLKPTYKFGKNIFEYLNYKPKFRYLNQMLKSNIKWFKKIY
tara:strand:+ start:600 stop:1547 length:948 start_codon:yes stop_codon:yes gene_type:complete